VNDSNHKTIEEKAAHESLSYLCSHGEPQVQVPATEQ
jgi:hypothetical protein